MDKVTVDAKALRRVLNACNNPVEMRELMALRGYPISGGENPIDRLIKDFNSQMEILRNGEDPSKA